MTISTVICINSKQFKHANSAKKRKIEIIFSLIGGIAGFIYYFFIGCSSGTCPIQSNPFFSVLWGLGVGFLIGDTNFIKKLFLKKEE